MKEHDKKWLAAGNFPHEAVLTGEVKSIVEEKQRFYYHRYIVIQTLQLQTIDRLVTAKKITPLTENVQMMNFHKGEMIRVFGSWEGSKFVFSYFEAIK